MWLHCPIFLYETIFKCISSERHCLMSVIWKSDCLCGQDHVNDWRLAQKHSGRCKDVSGCGHLICDQSPQYPTVFAHNSLWFSIKKSMRTSGCFKIQATGPHVLETFNFCMVAMCFKHEGFFFQKMWVTGGETHPPAILAQFAHLRACCQNFIQVPVTSKISLLLASSLFFTQLPDFRMLSYQFVTEAAKPHQKNVEKSSFLHTLVVKHLTVKIYI